MKVADCMTPEPACVAPEAPLTTATALMDAGDFRTLPVVKDGKLVGIITNRDIRKYCQKPETTKVGALMTERPICVSPDDSVAEGANAPRLQGWRFPVIRQHKVVGIITTTDILKAVLGLPELER